MDLVNRKILQRIFHIKFRPGGDAGPTYFGTGFTFERQNVQFMVSVYHIFPYTNHKQDIQFFVMRYDEWWPINSKIYKHPRKEVDIAVLSLDRELSPRTEINMTSVGIKLSQDAFFLGYPFQKFSFDFGQNNGFPFPFVKKGIFSSVSNGKPDDPVRILYLDAINNTGFSGGPCIFFPEPHAPVICGVVKGFHPEEVEIKTLGGKDYIEVNSGLVEIHSIHHVNEISLE
jgi:hypothetical protein